MVTKFNLTRKNASVTSYETPPNHITNSRCLISGWNSLLQLGVLKHVALNVATALYRFMAVLRLSRRHRDGGDITLYSRTHYVDIRLFETKKGFVDVSTVHE